jgi:hypothetical protein
MERTHLITRKGFILIETVCGGLLFLAAVSLIYAGVGQVMHHRQRLLVEIAHEKSMVEEERQKWLTVAVKPSS